MAKDFWINLPVKDIKKSKEFFTQIGFSFNLQYNNDSSACMLVGEKKVVVMLFEEAQFKGFTGKEIPNGASAEILLSIDAENKEGVDEMARKAVAAGGKSSHQPSEMNGWMYGCNFTDVDGHNWNVLHMDMSKMTR